MESMLMMLSSIQLDAFAMVARSGSFSEAAKRLHLTQSALSQRVLNLEEELRVSLFIREPGGARVTEKGERLLRYCQAREGLEGELLGDLQAKGKEGLAGVVRLAGFSTVVRSLLIPKLGAFGRANPRVEIEVLTREVRELPSVLRSGQADFILHDRALEKTDLENRLVGHEESVLIEPKNGKAPENVFVDHDELDATTADFWKLQKAAPGKYRRVYFDEIYSIVDAVEEGLGRAVVPRHLIEGNPRIAVVKGLRPLRTPIHLIYFKQAYYTRLQSRVIEVLEKGGDQRHVGDL